MENIPKIPATVKQFKELYWLKEDLIKICKEHGLPTTGSKADLIDYIACMIDKKPVVKQARVKLKQEIVALDSNMIILKNYANDENHRRFFAREIGNHFKFNVTFMNWMKENSGIKTYKEAILEWQRIAASKKSGNKIAIPGQFEYNQYTRDFFLDNPSLTKMDCIRCWKFKKGIPGNHKYEKSDLLILNF